MKTSTFFGLILLILVIFAGIFILRSIYINQQRDYIENQYQLYQKYQPEQLDPCSSCPQDPEISNCINNRRTITTYYCDYSTNYQCRSLEEDGPCVQPNEVQEYITREYRWSFVEWDSLREWDYTWNPEFSKAFYNYYKSKPRSSDYSVYVTSPYDDELISSLVSKIKDSAEKDGFNKAETLGLVVSFIQSLPYTSDRVTTGFNEYPKYPIETLVDNGGDCEDTSILAAALIKELGYGVVLLKLVDHDHVAVGVLCKEDVGVYYKDKYGNNYCYLETTGENWPLGVLPDEYAENSKAVIIHLT